jgi:hypothetical protein
MVHQGDKRPVGLVSAWRPVPKFSFSPLCFPAKNLVRHFKVAEDARLFVPVALAKGLDRRGMNNL